MYEPSFNKDQIYDNRTAKSILSEEKKVAGSPAETEKGGEKIQGRGANRRYAGACESSKACHWAVAVPC